MTNLIVMLIYLKTLVSSISTLPEQLSEEEREEFLKKWETFKKNKGN